VALPGEVLQAIGHAYQLAFVGALEASIKSFKCLYDVRTEPEKVSFKGRDGESFSFDFAGIVHQPFKSVEVFGESKGYTESNKLISDYKTFLIKSYVVSADHDRHRNDYFWFVTNVPFACSHPSGIKRFDFVKKTLMDAQSKDRNILGAGDLDDEKIEAMVSRLGVFILTDSFLTQTDILYQVKAGDSLWAILKKLHGGSVPPTFQSITNDIARRNQLQSPDLIRSDSVLKLRWFGIQNENASHFHF
jgi:hypothetical protein